MSDPTPLPNDSTEAWILKYRAAVGAVPAEQARSGKILAAIEKAYLHLASQVQKAVAKGLDWWSKRRNPFQDQVQVQQQFAPVFPHKVDEQLALDLKGST